MRSNSKSNWEWSATNPYSECTTNSEQSKVAVMAESTVLEDLESGKFDKSCRYFKMKKIKNLEAKTAQPLIKEYIDSK